MDAARALQFENIKSMIGNTPLLEISFTYQGEMRKIYAKAEYYNLTGSIKDRVAYYILEKAYEEESIAPYDIIAEATSGNTGIAFSALGRYLGHPVVIYMPDWMSSERINLMQSFGAEVRLVSAAEGGFLGSIQKCEDIAAGGGVFLPRQFENERNAEAHYYTTGSEIALQLSMIGQTADAVVAGVGTGGTVMGIGRRLRVDNPDLAVFPLEPESSPVLSTGSKVGSHRIQGISDEFIPPIYKKDEITQTVAVDDADAIIMAQMLSKELGIGVGISSGANFLGCIKAQEVIGSDKIIATVFADDNKKYLSTDYVMPQEAKEEFLTNHIHLLGVKAIPCPRE